MNTHRVPDLPVDRQIPLATLLDTDAMSGLIDGSIAETGLEVTGCRIRHVRYRPGDDCTVLYDIDYRMHGIEMESVWIHVRSGAGIAVSASCVANVPWVLGGLLAGPLLLPTLGAVGHEFPNDPRLPAIRAVADRDALGRDLAGVVADPADPRREFTGLGRNLRAIRYKPESRLVVRCRTRWRDRRTGDHTSERCLLRFERGAGSEQAARLTRQLAALDPDTATFSVPRVLFQAPALGCSGTEWIEGERLSRSLKETDARSRGLALAARALASLHGSSVAGVPVRGADVHLRAGAARQQRLAGYPADIRHLLDDALRLAGRLASTSKPGRQGTVHGDFHQGQVLLAGERPYLIDLDRVHHAEVVTDLGNFSAQLEVLGLRGDLAGAADCGEEFVAAYEQSARQPVDRRRLALWTGLALLELALKELRRLKPDWHARATAIATRGLEIMSGEET